MAPEFIPFPKIPRLRREVLITEKIDGTNACVVIEEDGTVYAQSRKRIITPDSDNYGFAAWAEQHQEMLRNCLGSGRHYGEWFGQGIQRGYGMTDRWFALFNVRRWRWGIEPDLPFAWFDEAIEELQRERVNVTVVPVVRRGHWSDDTIDDALERLRDTGSYVAPGFTNPEGVVVFHPDSRSLFKVLLENDSISKTEANGA